MEYYFRCSYLFFLSSSDNIESNNNSHAQIESTSDNEDLGLSISFASSPAQANIDLLSPPNNDNIASTSSASTSASIKDQQRKRHLDEADETDEDDNGVTNNRSKEARINYCINNKLNAVQAGTEWWLKKRNDGMNHPFIKDGKELLTCKQAGCKATFRRLDGLHSHFVSTHPQQLPKAEKLIAEWLVFAKIKTLGHIDVQALIKRATDN